MDILVVEDEAPMRDIIARNLRKRGHSVVEARTATEAMSALADAEHDLLLLDINLPDRSGWDVLRELKRGGRTVPSIIISAVRINPARIDEFRPLAYFPKPFPLDALLRVIENRSAKPKDVA